MISRFRIERFKCFADQTIEFSNLTLFAGGNATGKSTVIQALLLLRQAYLRGSLAEGELPLTGNLISIGTAKDAFYSNSDIDSIVFQLGDTNLSSEYVFAFAIESGQLDRYILLGDPLATVEESGALTPIDLSLTNLFGQQFTYLQAERLGPRLHYPMTELPPMEMNVGIQGEYTAHCLAEFGEDAINNPGLAYPGRNTEDYLSLRNQTRLWMAGITPNFDIEITPISEADRVLLGLKNRRSTSDFFLRPTNIGFGVSYSLPIIVAALMAKPGSILIIENPEAHLHPAAQSEMGQFLAQAAASGVQVIIETHSDHILNGIRLSVRQDVLPAEKVSIQFFSFSPMENEYEVLSPKIDADGRIDFWPDGFFDQIENDLLELF